MTPRQQIALALPCARAWDTLRSEFRAIVNWKGREWSSILSVNK